MIIDDQHYDVIIVGTGAGGGTLASKLASTGKKILILERGDFMPLEIQNRANVDIFKKELYRAPENWYDNAGEPFSPQTNYAVGGNTKIYGAALIRMREKDFETVKHQEGISPEWCLKYKDFEPYYTEAEKLYKVHGQVSKDPTEPTHSAEYPYPAVDHDPEIKKVVDAIAGQGLHPETLPLTLTREEEDPTGDSEVFGIAPLLDSPNITIKANAKVVCLLTNSSSNTVKAVEVEIGKQSFLFFADIVVLACGAVNSAALLLRSANEKHPDGLANSSGQVGRNLMKHLMTAVVQPSPKPNSGNFLRSVSVNDFYWGDENFAYPMGHIENTGGLLQDITFAESPPILSVLAKAMPGFGLKQLALRSIGWWLHSEIVPDPNNRVEVKGDKLFFHYTPNNWEAHDRLVHRWMDVLKLVDKEVGNSVLKRGSIYPRGEVPIEVVANQCGTCRFGEDPKTSVLDINCRTHDVDNLYVVDSSFFPSSSAVTPALTIIANALRVGEHLKERLQ
ncbi:MULTISPECIES: GMC oxidoreductase [Okeania]|uniref:GMC family oxidoreductase n=1 Tax=Okeania hirsuta TaxID=1458930 RepID=A0A3N6NVV5_9CYAN|nr:MULTISPECIES: GMC family oxidoreductase [Okeania]NET16363.1 GMC family oxidoreductase [Okeania sp. SIO1H6]NES74893.1 GMC family oxidoreductase [Okeania sp. SIO1H4]NES90881.1 GMC family oxidoreductase [Okeania sp. SIO2B9]NET20783.1 GMC family oxidoreductase [Okeania sp. SIO1H5]NET75159.1 GMC family oxidoreductase [Okeania sp. SIO1F9]